MRLLGGIVGCVLFSVSLFSESHTISWPLMVKHTPKGDRIDVPLNSGMHRLIFDSQTPYDYGDKVRIVGETAVCSEPRNPGAFNFCACIQPRCLAQDHQQRQIAARMLGRVCGVSSLILSAAVWRQLE